eukprot:8815718-Heterocapsa_arctica.AAC.1
MEVAAHEAHPSWKKEGPDNNWNQGPERQGWHWQGKPPSGSESPLRSTQPQWECNHDQKKGVRIGESKIPAQPGKTWTS